MMQSGMNSTGIYQVRKGHLLNAPQPLVPRVRNYLENQLIINGYKAINGVINDLSYAVCHSLPAILLKLLPKAAGKSTKAVGIN
jgi:hypothetical protein